MNRLCIAGISGSVYEFSIYPLPYFFIKDKGAVFLFIRHINQKLYVPIYLGICDNLREDLNNYWSRMNEEGATHIGIFTEDDKVKREFVLTDLSNFA